MKMPDIALYLITALACADAAAFQLGQLTQHSRLGEPLDARVTLYGLSRTAAATTPPAVTVKPAIGLPPGSRARRAAEDISATLATDANGTPYLALRSSTPVTAASFDFRLRVAIGAETMIAHYTIALDTSPRARSDVPASRTRPAGALRRSVRNVPAAPTVAHEAADADRTSRYGPVRPGQSLWLILGERGLHQRDREAIIEQIVADNPHAFVDGNADRLRVGVMLTLPGQRAEELAVAVQAQAGRSLSIPTPATLDEGRSESRAPATTAGLDQDTAALAARLEALSAKFADIRARYAAQEAASPTVSPAPAMPRPTLETDAAGVADAGVADTAITEPGAADTFAPAADMATVDDITAPAPAPAAATSLSTYILLGAGALVSTLALVGGILMAVRASRRKRLQGHIRTTEQALVAEITRKAEKRLLLEDSVKRRMNHNRQPPSAAPGEPRETALHEVDHRIAHGQYAEARAMLDDVISAAPSNYRAKLRLAEICYLDEDRAAFVAIADDIYRQHRADIGDEGWQRVMRMGRVLAPDQPPFSGPVVLGRQA